MRWGLLLLVGCAHHTPVAAPSCEHDDLPDAYAGSDVSVVTDAIPITDVHVAAPDPSLRVALEGVVDLKAGALNADQIRDTIRKLWATGIVSDVEATVDHDELTFEVTPQPLIDHVTIVGASKDDPSMRRIRALAGTPFERPRLARMAAAIEASWVYRGYRDAHVDLHRQGNGVCVKAWRGPIVTIGEIHFTGTHDVSEATLKAVLVGKKGINVVGGIYDPTLFERDRWLVQAAYWNRGKANVSLGETKLERHGDHVDLVTHVEEGATYSLGTITYPPIAKLDLKSGERFSRDRIADANQFLQDRIGKAGTVTPVTHVDPDRHVMDVAFEIQWRFPWDMLQFLR
ncbi:MAG: POTRA domain-containing protein [Kofleriaceae bacterium]